MKCLDKKFFAFILLVMLLILMPFGNVKAALQANPNTYYKNTNSPENWLSSIRSMEKSGNAMGLSETLNSDLTASSESNGIDVHMMRSTEYGAMAILSASGYGNPSKLQNSSVKTTTGNKTGVYVSNGYWEHVAGGHIESTRFKGVNEKYYDAYTENQSSAKVGDALGNKSTTNPGCEGWHTDTYNFWFDKYCCNSFSRGYRGLFNFSRYNGNDDIGREFYPWTKEYARGVAVVGAGL